MFASGFIDFVEPLENAVDLFFGDALAGVGDADERVAVRLFHTDPDGAALVRELDRVVEEVVSDLEQEFRVRLHLDVGQVLEPFDDETAFVHGAFKAEQCVEEELVQVGGRIVEVLFPRFDLGQRQHGDDQPGKALDLARDDAEVPAFFRGRDGPVEDAVHESADSRHRGLQFVGDIRDETLTGVLDDRQGRCHVVQRLRQFLLLLGAPDFEAFREVALRILFRETRHLFHRTDQLSCEHVGQQDHDDEGDERRDHEHPRQVLGIGRDDVVRGGDGIDIAGGHAAADDLCAADDLLCSAERFRKGGDGTVAVAGRLVQDGGRHGEPAVGLALAGMQGVGLGIDHVAAEDQTAFRVTEEHVRLDGVGDGVQCIGQSQCRVVCVFLRHVVGHQRSRFFGDDHGVRLEDIHTVAVPVPGDEHQEDDVQHQETDGDAGNGESHVTEEQIVLPAHGFLRVV